MLTWPVLTRSSVFHGLRLGWLMWEQPLQWKPGTTTQYQVKQTIHTCFNNTSHVQEGVQCQD